jgi:hypothetical protein
MAKEKFTPITTSWPSGGGVRGIALPMLDLGTRREWLVITTPGLFYPLERPGTHFTAGWVGRSGRVRKITPPPGFFFFAVSCASLSWYWTFNCRLCRLYRVVLHVVDFLEKSDGFGRERTRDLGYQRPA